MTKPKRRRIALREGSWRDDVESFAYFEDLFITGGSKSGEQPYESIWASADDALVLHYIEDPVLGWAYLQAEGEGAAQLIERAESALPAIPLEEAVSTAAAAEPGQPWVDALYLLAVSASPDEPADAGIVREFDRALTDGDTQAKQAAIYATGYLGWPELQAHLRRVAADDADDEVRRNAELMLEGIDQAGV